MGAIDISGTNENIIITFFYRHVDLVRFIVVKFVPVSL